jgi:hypothetical protein
MRWVIWFGKDPIRTTDGTQHFSAKLAKPFVGPFTISERLGKNVYALVDDLGVFKGKWHVKDLKPDHTREREDDRDSSSPEFAGREYEDSDGDSDTSSDQ